MCAEQPLPCLVIHSSWRTKWVETMTSCSMGNSLAAWPDGRVVIAPAWKEGVLMVDLDDPDACVWIASTSDDAFGTLAMMHFGKFLLTKTAENTSEKSSMTWRMLW